MHQTRPTSIQTCPLLPFSCGSSLLACSSPPAVRSKWWKIKWPTSIQLDAWSCHVSHPCMANERANRILVSVHAERFRPANKCCQNVPRFDSPEACPNTKILANLINYTYHIIFCQNAPNKANINPNLSAVALSCSSSLLACSSPPAVRSKWWKIKWPTSIQLDAWSCHVSHPCLATIKYITLTNADKCSSVFLAFRTDCRKHQANSFRFHHGSISSHGHASGTSGQHFFTSTSPKKVVCKLPSW